LQTGKKTVMMFSGYKHQEIPDRYFQKDYLEKMK
jgi:hypothetical protein